MITDKYESDALLERAYNLNSDDESKALYRDWAETYDETMMEGLGYLSPSKAAELLVRFHKDRDGRVLDIGSGTGLAGVELKNRGYAKIDALDYSADMLGVAAKRGVYGSCHEIDLNNPVPLESNSYDVLISTGTFTHAHVDAGCLDELFRILRPGGLFVCTVHKDVWEPEGFEQKIARLTTAGMVETVYQEADYLFKDASDKEGWFIVWERLK